MKNKKLLNLLSFEDHTKTLNHTAQSGSLMVHFTVNNLEDFLAIALAFKPHLLHL